MLNYLEYNKILYDEITNYLKSNKERIGKDLFMCILSACRLVYTGTKVTKACRLAGIVAGGEHIDGNYIAKYVNPIMEIALPKLKEIEGE